MARPRLNDELSPANVFDRMEPGKTYGASNIAAKLRARTDAIRPLLEQMVRDGLIEVSRERPAMIGFRRPIEQEAAAVAEASMLSVAAPRIPLPTTGELTGYSAEIARRVALCMTLRGAR